LQRGEARTTDVVIANDQSKNANTWGGDHCATGVINALNCGDGRGIAGATTTTTTTTTREQTSLTAAGTMAIMLCSMPKRQRITGPSRESRNKSLDNSAEGGGRRRHCNDDGRTRQWQRQSAGSEGNKLPRQLPREATRVGGGGRQRQPTKTVDDDGKQLEWLDDNVV
jgi:hypothetical protein